MNYRSAVVFGKGRLIESGEEKLDALERLSDHVIPGRWDDARKPNGKEMKATQVASVDIAEFSVKARNGPPSDDLEDYQLPIWAGVVPIKQSYQPPENDPRLEMELAVPDYARDYDRRANS
jgi:hypothetical protein